MTAMAMLLLYDHMWNNQGETALLRTSVCRYVWSNFCWNDMCKHLPWHQRQV